MDLHRYVFSYEKGKVLKQYLNIYVSMYILNGTLPSSAKTFMLLVIFLTPNTCLHSDICNCSTLILLFYGNHPSFHKRKMQLA